MPLDNNAVDEFLSLLEPAYADSAQRYQQLRAKLVKFFSWRRCDDPHILADETVSRLAKNIGTGESVRTDKLYSYVYGIASNVFREHVREKQKYPEAPESAIDAKLPPPLRAKDCRKECLQALSDAKIELLRRYYLVETDMEELAQSLGLTITALRLQVHRIKKEIRACYDDCMKTKS